MVSTLDSESSDPSSNLGGTYHIFQLRFDRIRDPKGCDVRKMLSHVHFALLAHTKTIEKVAPDVGLEPTTLGLLELRWLASKSPMLYRLS